jgi:hypothetical protein
MPHESSRDPRHLDPIRERGRALLDPISSARRGAASARARRDCSALPDDGGGIGTETGRLVERAVRLGVPAGESESPGPTEVTFAVIGLDGKQLVVFR